MEDTPTAVLIRVGHSEHSVTVMAEVRNAFSNQRIVGDVEALTTMVTIGSHASGETGLKIWISGLMAAFTVGDRPQRSPAGPRPRLRSGSRRRRSAGW